MKNKLYFSIFTAICLIAVIVCVIVNITLSKMILEPIIDIWDILNILILLIISIILFMVDYLKNKNESIMQK